MVGEAGGFESAFERGADRIGDGDNGYGAVREKEKSKMISQWEETALPEMGKIPGELPMRTTQGATCHVTDQRKPWERLCHQRHMCPHVKSKWMCVPVTDTHTFTGPGRYM